MQALDVTTLGAVLAELRAGWLPARVESVRQDDPFTVRFILRRAQGQGLLEASCHPVAARLHLSSQRLKGKYVNRYPFCQQLFQYLATQVLVAIEQPAWERVAVLVFAPRPNTPETFRFYIEIMGKYSNLILTDPQGKILCCAHTVSDQQSRVRPLTPGDSYTPPPPLTRPIPDLNEAFINWQQRVGLLPIALEKALIDSYRGVSKILARQLLKEAHISSSAKPMELSYQQWEHLFQNWQAWLQCQQTHSYIPGFTADGYTVLGWGVTQNVATVNELLDTYYNQEVAQTLLKQQQQRLTQILNSVLTKARAKLKDFLERQFSAENAQHLKQKADTLMAQGFNQSPGQNHITLLDLETDIPLTISLNPARDLIANAQDYYRRYRKANRAIRALDPLIQQMQVEVAYLESVSTQLEQADLGVLQEIDQELRTTGYITKKAKTPNKPTPEVNYYRFQTPNGLTILCGRNNRQNEEITFTVAQPQDLWFHAQEIPGAHVLLQLPPGIHPDPPDLAAAANVAAHFSRARQSGQVPVLYTPRQQVRKLKGHLPGLVTYMQFQVLWGKPDELPPAL